MPRWVVKLFALVGTFVLPLLCTLLPYKVSGYIARKGASGKRLLSYLMCLGGGIFFGTYLLHMGPEVQTILKHSLLDPYGITYPLAELIVGVGFFIVLFAEKLVLRWNKRRVGRKGKDTRRLPVTPELTVGLTDVEQTSCNGSKCARSPSQQMCPKCIEGKRCSGDQHAIHAAAAADIREHTATVHSDEQQSATGGEQRSAAGDALSSRRLLSADNSDTVVVVTAAPSAAGGAACVDADASPLCREAAAGSAGTMHGSGHHHATRSLILILALSLHRIFEGMTIGLQQSVTSVVSLFGAVMCHEMVIGFSLGLQFVRSGFALRRLVITSLICSLIMPLGVLIGLVMTEAQSTGSSVDIANGLLQAIAMGTFIYVTFFEILQEEVDSEDTSLGKIVCIAAGFAIMALLDLIPEEDDSAARANYVSMSTFAPPVNSTWTAA